MWFRTAIFPVIAFILCAPAMGRQNAYSWKKSGNSYAQFVADSVTCAKHGYLRDVSQDQAAKSFIRGTQTASDDLNAPLDDTSERAWNWRDSQRRTQPARKIQEVQDLQVRDVEKCLTQQGYTKFALTKQQSKRLNRLPYGSEIRRRYLYEISVE